MDKQRVVIADDERRTCQYFRAVLERLGHEVVAEAHDGRELVRQWERHRPDLVVADVKMPDRDGVWAAEVIDEKDHTPVILVSAFHEPDVVDLTTARNISAYLVKPVKPDDLEMAIAVALRKSSG